MAGGIVFQEAMQDLDYVGLFFPWECDRRRRGAYDRRSHPRLRLTGLQVASRHFCLDTALS